MQYLVLHPVYVLLRGIPSRQGLVCFPPPFGRGTLALTCCRKRGWVGARRVALLYVSSRPPLRTVRAAFTAHGSAPLVNLPSKAMKRRFPLRPPSQMPSSVLHPLSPAYPLIWVQLARSLGTWFAVSLCTSSSQRLGAFAISPHPGGHGFPVRRLLCPIRLSVRALAFRWGLPSLLPTRLPIPREVSRVRHGRLKRNEVGGVLLAAPSVLYGSPVTIHGRSG